MIWGGSGYGYASPWLKVGGFGVGMGVTEEFQDGDFSVGLAGGGPMLGFEDRFADLVTFNADLGIAFGLITGDRTYSQAVVKGVDGDDVEVRATDYRFGVSYVLSAGIDFDIIRWLRAGVRVQFSVSTDHGASGLHLFSPGAGLILLFGNHPSPGK